MHTDVAVFGAGPIYNAENKLCFAQNRLFVCYTMAFGRVVRVAGSFNGSARSGDMKPKGRWCDPSAVNWPKAENSAAY